MPDTRLPADLPEDAGTERPGQAGDLQDAGGEDDRGGQQEGEAGGVLVRQTAGQAGDHRRAGAADPGQQGKDLGDMAIESAGPIFTTRRSSVAE
jgi:hypothetical protein